MTKAALLTALATDAAPRTYAELMTIASPFVIRGAVAAGDLTRLVPDQYCLAEHDASWLMRAHAAVAWAGPGAALTGLAALAARGFAPWPVDTIDVVVPAGGHKRGPEWIRVRSLSAPFDAYLMAPNTRITSSELAVALAYGNVAPRDRARLVHGAIRAGVTSVDALQQASATLPRFRARPEFDQRMRRIAAGAESYLEERGMADVFRGAKLSGVKFQHRVRVRGEVFRVDAVHLPTKTVFELDGREGHDGPTDRQKDIRRDGLLATLGHLTVRWTYFDTWSGRGGAVSSLARSSRFARSTHCELPTGVRLL